MRSYREVVRMDQNFVITNAGPSLKSYIPIEEFRNDRGEVETKAEATMSRLQSTHPRMAVMVNAFVAGQGQTYCRMERPGRRRSTKVRWSTA